VPPPVQLRSGSSNASHVILPLEKAAIKLPAASVLLYRSDAASSQAFLKDLAAALKPYRADDYSEASRRLGNLSRKYPNSPEVPFYLGVSQLFLNDNTHAVDSLQAAGRLAGETLRDSISWYLIVALNREGRDQQALVAASTLCAQAGEYKQKACAAADEMKHP
jgi:predicted Zn-dependent protease